MKQYRCVFIFSRGQTTLDVLAGSPAGALAEARLTVNIADAAVEIWDETGLVLEHRRYENRAL